MKVGTDEKGAGMLVCFKRWELYGEGYSIIGLGIRVLSRE